MTLPNWLITPNEKFDNIPAGWRIIIGTFLFFLLLSINTIHLDEWLFGGLLLYRALYKYLTIEDRKQRARQWYIKEHGERK